MTKKKVGGLASRSKGETKAVGVRPGNQEEEWLRIINAAQWVKNAHTDEERDRARRELTIAVGFPPKDELQEAFERFEGFMAQIRHEVREYRLDVEAALTVARGREAALSDARKAIRQRIARAEKPTAKLAQAGGGKGGV